MTAKRKVEVFSAGCAACEETIEMIVCDMNDINVAKRAKALGIRSVPSVVIDGQFAGCCAGRGVDETILKAAGLGRSL